MEETIHSKSANSQNSAYFFRKIYSLCLLIASISIFNFASLAANSYSSTFSSSIENLETNDITEWPFSKTSTPPTEICDNGIDDDGDMLIDCADPDCYLNESASTDVPKSISSSSATTITSTLNISESGTIEDINIKNLGITHSYIDDIVVRLISPSNTTVIVLNQPCNSENNILMSLDDEASSGSFPCPPTNGQAYIPANALSAFDNEEMNGTWTLSVQDLYGPSDGGSLNSWTLEITKECSGGVEICDDGIDNDGDLLVDCDDPDCSTSGDVLSAAGDVRNGPASNAEGAPDNVTTEVGHVDDYLVVTLEDELPIGTEYTIYISGRNGSATSDVWEAPDGTSIPNSQQDTPAGFTLNGQAIGPQDVVTPVVKTAVVATKYIYFDRGSGDIEIDAVTYEISCTSTSDVVCTMEVLPLSDQTVCEGDIATLSASVTQESQCLDCDTENTLIAYYDLNACLVNGNSGPIEFQEFYTSVNDLSCADVTASTLYKEIGAHSCAFGLSGQWGDWAPCSIMPAIENWQDDHPNAWRFQVDFNSTNSDYNTFSGLEFSISNIVGDDPDDQNPSQEWGFRILRNGTEIYKEIDNPFPLDENWYTITRDFSNNSNFQNAGNSTYSFELLTYNPQINGYNNVSMMDIDEVKVFGKCCLPPTNTSEVEYLWSTGDTTQNIDVTLAGTYTVTVSDCANCAVVDTVILNHYTSLNASGIDGAICDGSTGSVTVNEGGGLAPYSYAWSNGSTLKVNGGLSPNTTTSYTVTITDANGCTDVTSASLIVNPNPTAGATNDGPIDCNMSDIILTATPAGMSYEWEDGSTGLTRMVNSAGTYFVTVTDGNLCSDIASTEVVFDDPVAEITGPTEICVSQTTTLSPNSGGTWTSSDILVATVTNAGIVTAVSIGTATFTFTSSQGCVSAPTGIVTVSPGGNTNITGDDIICEGETTQLTASTGGGTWLSSNTAIATVNSSGLVTAVSSGSVTITYDKSSQSCQADGTFGIVILDIPTVTITGATNICAGENTQLTTTGSGGFWTSSDSNIAVISSSGTVAGIAGGTVSFTYTNSDGCESSASGNITVDPVIGLAIDFNGSLCLEDDSQLSAIVTGGTANYTYSWTGPNGFSETTQTVDITINGNYNVTVTDSKGCSTNTTAFVYEQYEPFIFTLNSEVCEGEDVTLSVNGAAGGSFQWDANANNATTSSVTVTPGVPTTSYTVTVTNSIGCSTSATAVIDVIAKPVVSVTGADEICVGSTTQLSPASGGIWTSSDYSVANVSNTGLVSGTGNGTVTFTFRDDVTGCYSDPSAIVSVNENASVSISGDDQICMGENPTLTASVVGGTWSSDNLAIATINSGTGEITPVAAGNAEITYTAPSTGCYLNTTYNINIHDIPVLTLNGPATICEGSITFVSSSTSGTWTSSDESVATISNIGEISGLAPGTATISFVSVVGCQETLGTSITVLANPIVSLTGPGDICINETTSLSPTSGGVWISSNNSVATVNSGGVVTGVSEGNASFTFIESTYGCVSENTVTVSVNAPPNINAPASNSLCIGESTNITPASGGSWQSSNTAIATITNDGTITAVSDGSVTFMFTSDLTGCISAASSPITVQPTPTITFSGPTSICQEETTSIQPSIGGFWSSTDVSIATINNQGVITGVSPGNVQFIFTNTNSGCVSDSSNVLTVVQPATVSVSGPSSICVGNTTSLSPNSGGMWTSTNTSVASVTNSGLVTGVSPGTVSFIFQNGSGCNSEPTEEITVNAMPSPTFLGESTICIGEVSTLSPTTGGGWSSSNAAIATITNGGIVTAVTAGTVTLTFTDSTTGCSSDADAVLTVNSPPTISIIGGDEVCIGGNTNLSPTSGGAWISGDNSIASVAANGTVTGISAGDVAFTFIESATGCTSEDSAPITVLPRPDVNIDGSNTICVGSTTTLTPSTGGVWTSTNESVATVTNDGVVTGISQGLARFTFTSTQGCASNETAPVIVFDKPGVFIDGPSSICIGAMAQMIPSNGGTWQSADPSIATIDNSGMVTALAAGTTTFTFTDLNTGCISDPSEPLTIESVPVTSLTGPSEICIGSTTNMLPSSNGIWTSLNPLVASIQNNGEIVGMSAGEAKFIFMSLTTGCYSDTTSGITVVSGPDILFNGPTELCLGDTTYITPSSGGTWESMNVAVATITNGGMIIGVGEGSVNFQFTETSSNCKSELSETLTVYGAPTVGIAGPSTICINADTYLTPSSGGSWVSLNPSIASIDGNGVVTGLTEGTAFFVFTDDITGCVTDGSLSIDVQASPQIEITGSDKICLGYTTTLSPSISGIWTSSNPSIASVSNSGVVTGLAPGVVTFQFMDPITGCTSDGSSDPVTIVNCTNHDFNVTLKDEVVYGDLNTNDKINGSVEYGGIIETISKPLASIPILTINTDGSYSFESNKAGKYIYRVPICILPIVDGCEGTILEINVVENIYTQENPVSNLEFTTTYTGALSSDPGLMVEIDALANDTCIYSGSCSFDKTSIGLIGSPNNGVAIINANNNIEYTPNAGFMGLDTIDYSVCLDDGITCSQSQEIIIVNDNSALNSTVANDDFYFTMRESSISGNIMQNDYDPEGHSISVVAAGTSLNPVVIPEGSYFISGNGDFNFTPTEDFVGTLNIEYTLCDNLFEPYCANATIHLMVLNDLSLNLRVYLEGALLYNEGAETQSGLPLMRDDLRVSPFTGENYIPTSDPYSVGNDPFMNTQDKFTQVGPGLISKNQLISDSLGVFSVLGDNAIVDWVHVEMRSKDDNTLVIGTRSGLVQRDGDIVDLDGTSSLRFQGVFVDSFYVVVKHRSHLGVMSQLVTNDELIDFTDPNYPVFNFGTTYGNGFDYTGLSRKNSVVYGFSALWAGDFDSNGKVKFTNPEDDQNLLFLGVLFSSPEFLINYDNAYGYLTSDFDMNSKSKYTNPKDDLNLLFSQILLYPLNTSFLSNFSSLIEQIPE